MKQITASVVPDQFTAAACSAFDVPFNGTTTFDCFDKPEVPADYSIGLLVGPSGSGKSLLLREFGTETQHTWNKDKAIVSHFASPDEAINRLMAVGLNSIPSWLRPYQVLSTGERFRADLAMSLENGAVVDEFTSTVDRNVAKAASCAIRRYADKSGLRNLTLATCHYDILEWLRPDWYFDTATGILHDGRLLRRPAIRVQLYPCKRGIWTLFRKHHYLSHTLSNACHAFLVTAKFGASEHEEIVGFASALAFPHAHIKGAWRGHRMVVLPDYQGLGLGPRISDAVAQHYLDLGKRYYSRTAHVRLITYRDHSPLWRKISRGSSKKGTMGQAVKRFNNWGGDDRPCASHEYLGVIKNDNQSQ